MKFRKFINERSRLPVEEIVKILKKDCGPFLRETKSVKNFMWRGGLGISVADIKKNVVRKGRLSRDMSHWLHKLLDETFEDNFGWKTRSNSAFAVGSRPISLKYGTPYLFFPIGKYNYIWSPTIKDLYEHLRRLFGIEFPPDTITEEWIEENIISEYIDKNLVKVVKNSLHNEVMFNCKKYYLVDDDYEVGTTFEPPLADLLWK